MIWYFIEATATDDNDDDNTPSSTVTTTANTNNSNNYNNNNIIIIKIIITIKMKSGCALIKIIKSSYIYCSPVLLFREKNASLLCACKCKGCLLFLRNLVNYSK